MKRLLGALLILSVLLPLQGWAAVSIDTATTGTNASTGTTTTVSHTVTGSNLELLCGTSLYVGSGETITGVTYNGVALTQIATQLTGDVRVDIWALKAPATGAHNWVVTASVASDVSAGCVSFTGVDQTTPLGTAATGTGTSTSPAVTVTSAAGELVFAVLGFTSGSGTTPTDGQTNRYLATLSGTHFETLFASGTTTAGAASVNMTATIDNSWNWAMDGVSLKPAAGAAAETFGFRLRLQQ